MKQISNVLLMLLGGLRDVKSVEIKVSTLKKNMQYRKKMYIIMKINRASPAKFSRTKE